MRNPDELKKRVKDAFFALREGVARDNKKLILFVSCILIFICLDFSFLLGPQARGLRETGKRIAKISSDCRKLNKDLLLMQDFQQKQSALGADYLKPKKTFWLSEQPALLELVSAAANNHDLRLMQINASQDAKAREIVIKDSSPAGRFSCLVINLELYGDYHALGRYLNELESSVSRFGLSSLHIVYDQHDLYRQKITMTARLYVKK
jgi:hypothetical protein